MNNFKNFSTPPILKKYIKNNRYVFTYVQSDKEVAEAIVLKDDKSLWLIHLYVSPKYRGQGYVRNLLNEVDKLSKELKLPIYLKTWSLDSAAKSDEDLINMYKKFGYKQIVDKPIGTMVKYEE